MNIARDITELIGRTPRHDHRRGPGAQAVALPNAIAGRTPRPRGATASLRSHP
jgi:hypothetical protein